MKLVAHRGYSARYPENTLVALEAALQLGVAGVEFDVQMSRDGQLFVMHDANLQRTTGIDAMVYATSTTELAKLSASEPARFGTTFAGEPIPTLHQALKLLCRYPAAKAFVEIKRHSLEHFGVREVMDALLEILANHHDQCTLISFSTAAVAYARQHSALETGWVLRRYDSDSQTTALRLDPDYLVCDQELLPVQPPLWPGRWQWMTYETNDPGAVIPLRDKGITYIETAAVETMLASPLFRAP